MVSREHSYQNEERLPEFEIEPKVGSTSSKLRR